MLLASFFNKEYVSFINKNYIAMLHRLRLIEPHMGIALTYKIKAVGSRQVGDIMVWVCVFFLWRCVGCV